MFTFSSVSVLNNVSNDMPFNAWRTHVPGSDDVSGGIKTSSVREHPITMTHNRSPTSFTYFISIYSLKYFGNSIFFPSPVGSVSKRTITVNFRKNNCLGTRPDRFGFPTEPDFTQKPWKSSGLGGLTLTKLTPIVRIKQCPTDKQYVFHKNLQFIDASSRQSQQRSNRLALRWLRCCLFCGYELLPDTHQTLVYFSNVHWQRMPTLLGQPPCPPLVLKIYFIHGYTFFCRSECFCLGVSCRSRRDLTKKR